MSVRLVVLGNINIDFVVEAERLPRPGETLRAADDFQIIPGGKAANQAVAAARLGAQVALIGRVGDDPFGPALIENLRRENINTDFITLDDEATTGAAFITVMPDGQNAITSVLGANLRCSPEQVEAAAAEIERSDMLLVQLGVAPEVVDRAIQIAVDREVLVQLDPSPIGQALPQLWRRCHILVPNETEAGHLLNMAVTEPASAVEAAGRLRELGVMIAVITMGAAGCVVASNDNTYLVGGYEVASVDATAAGDAFAAAFATGLGEGMPLLEAAAFANAAGALATTVSGAQPSLPRREAVQKFLHERGGPEGAPVEEL